MAPRRTSGEAKQAVPASVETAVELKQKLAFARDEVLRLSEANRELARRVAELEAVRSSVRESRRAALNVLEDAMRSNQVAERLNEELKHEINERARAESALRASDERMRTIADGVPQIIWANEPDGVATYFNRRWYEYTGLSAEESTGPGWQAVVHPDDAIVSRRKWLEALASGEPFDAEYRLRRADGEYRWFIGRNVPLRDATGRISGWFGTATDIQELKEAQAVAHEREEQF
ncbi:MAG TPA: PAS domain-containing protein, partial [Candidatus Synoicihabitans sp.]|nr:PAS domain-containing protein [Candidatus Synoicihabitans sp.]